MKVQVALSAIEAMLEKVKGGSIKSESFDYLFLEDKHRFVLNTCHGSLTYLKDPNEDDVPVVFFESFTGRDPASDAEIHLGDQKQPRLELDEDDQTRFRDLIAHFLS